MNTELGLSDVIIDVTTITPDQLPKQQTLETYQSPGISFLLHSVNLILFTLLLVHLILSISPHHMITVIIFALTICHTLDLSLQT